MSIETLKLEQQTVEICLKELDFTLLLTKSFQKQEGYNWRLVVI